MRHAFAILMAILISGGPLRSNAAADLPPSGRSLFDHMTSRTIGGHVVQRVPYPFQALLAEIERHAGTDALGRPGIAAVLIPLGRSLQRNASPGHYFEHPRVVVAVSGEPRDRSAPLLLKDRLFVGFQDAAGIIEVISYNESAGRFEFQVVTDYRPGGTPRVFYARRAICTACHHAAGPIFSRPSWDETNANPAVARALSAHAGSFHGVAVARGVDLPNSIDDAVARANRLAMLQTLWRDTCEQASPPSDAIACRQAVLVAALRLRLGDVSVSAGSAESRDPSLRALMLAWKDQWPTGLPEPDPNIPNRDPFFGQAQQLSHATATPWGAEEITPAIDPMAPRPPVALWRADRAGLDRLVRTLASMFADADIVALSHRLEQPPRGQRAGFAAIEGAAAAIAAHTRSGRSDVFAALPFRRAATVAALFGELGIRGGPICCDQSSDRLPPARLEGEQRSVSRPLPDALRAFYLHCGTCHRMPSASPPGFLYGEPAAVEQNLRRCARRIRFRLQMWRLDAAARPKVPMPPPAFVPAWEHNPPREDLDRMLDYVGRLIAAPDESARTLAYEMLPACREQRIEAIPVRQ